MLGSALALGSAGAAGASDFLGGVLSRRIGALPYLFIAQAPGLPLALAAVLLTRSRPPDLAGVAAGLVAGVAVGGGLAAFFEAAVRAPISVVSPITSVGVVVPIVAGIVQGQRPTPTQAVGMAGAVLGIVLVSRSRDEASLHPITATGLGLSVLSAIGAGLFFWLMAPASRDGVAWAVLLARIIPTAALAGTLMARRRRPAPPLGGPAVAGQLTLCSMLGLAAISLYAASTRYGQLGIVAVLGSMFPVAVVVLALVFLRERLSLTQRVGIVVLMLAVAMMTA